MVVAALQQDGLGEYIPDPQVDAHRGNGIRQDLLYSCFNDNLFHDIVHLIRVFFRYHPIE